MAFAQSDAAATSLRRVLEEATHNGATAVTVGNSSLDGRIPRERIAEVAARLADRNLVTLEQLAERAMRGVDMEREAADLGLSALQTAGLFQAALHSLSPDVLSSLRQAVNHPQGLGGLPLNDPGFIEARRDTPVATSDDIAQWPKDPSRWIFRPLGPTAAIDHRPWLGPARDQAGRVTCSSFAATAVMEALEFLRDRRPGPRDLSEELLWWYSERGQLYTAGGYDCATALRHYTEYGSCEESLFPYFGTEVPLNHAQAPAPDDAMDRARFFTSDAIVALPITGAAGDISAVKAALASGRCVTIASDHDNWDTGAGLIGFPADLTSLKRGGSHCTTIIGYIDDDGLPAVAEGGYFILRNSWGGAGSAANALGPDYGGHLLMPYGWYRRCVSAAATFVDADANRASGRQWRAQYYLNTTLSGAPFSEVTLGEPDLDWNGHVPIVVDLLGFEVDLPPSEDYSARFSQIRRFRPGWWRFTLTGDDGVRLWVDDRLVINGWRDQAATPYTEEYYLTGGDHVVRVEYYQRGGGAALELRVDPMDFHYDLYPNADLDGLPPLHFDDTMTDLEWRHAAPVRSPHQPGVFSLVAEGQKHFRAGHYRFHAEHTGGCRIRLDGALVLDDWAGLSGTGDPVSVTDGTHVVAVEFCHRGTEPSIGSHDYYRAALSFGWSEAEWHMTQYKDSGRQAISAANFPNPDSLYEAFRTDALAGPETFTALLPADNAVPGQYAASELAADIPLHLKFNDLTQFSTGIAGAPDLSGGHSDWLGVYLRRRFHVATAGRYEVHFSADDGNRLIIDGKQLAGSVRIDDNLYQADVDLTAGVHDVGIEYANTMWGGDLELTIQLAAWRVDYFFGRDLASLSDTVWLDAVEKFVDADASAVGTTDFSLRAQRTLFCPAGRYRVQVRVGGGLRVKVGGLTMIDAWIDQEPTSYTAFVEHRGGELPIEIEYYQSGDSTVLEFALTPEGFIGEYYRGTTLDKPPAGSTLDRNVPVAYRFEPELNFDWGQSGPLPRVGATQFSARWLGPLNLPSGRWKLSLTSDDGVRAFLDGRMIIDTWHDRSATQSSAIIDLAGRTYDLIVEYYQGGGSASCRFAAERLY